MSDYTVEVDFDVPFDLLISRCGFDDVHFFFEQPIEVDEPRGKEVRSFSLMDLSHEGKLTEAPFGEEHSHATLRELLFFSMSAPELQREVDILALGTMRMRRVYDDRPGETVWGKIQPHQPMCQWVGCLTGDESERKLFPIELFLDDILLRKAAILVRTKVAHE